MNNFISITFSIFETAEKIYAKFGLHWERADFF